MATGPGACVQLLPPALRDELEAGVAARVFASDFNLPDDTTLLEHISGQLAWERYIRDALALYPAPGDIDYCHGPSEVLVHVDWPRFEDGFAGMVLAEAELAGSEEATWAPF